MKRLREAKTAKESLAIEEIALHLGLARMRTRRGRDEGRRGWLSVSEDISRETESEIRELAGRYFQVAHDAVFADLLDVRELAALHGIDAFFRPRFYTVFSIRSWPVVYLALWRVVGRPTEVRTPELVQEGLEALQIIGEILGETDPPWTKRYEQVYVGLGQVDQPPDIRAWSDAQRFAAWAAIAVEAEAADLMTKQARYFRFDEGLRLYFAR